MASSFLEFFAARQAERAEQHCSGAAAAMTVVQEPSAAALEAAAAAPINRARAPLPAIPETSSVSAAGRAADATGDASVPWAEVEAARHRLGRQLAALRAEQDQQPFARRESYSEEHVRRLEMFRPARPYQKPRSNMLCAKAHPQPCPYGCKTCHFCRQRSVEQKTVCSLCEGVGNYYGGAGRGYWCGSCLWLRVGENIEEVRGRSDWICPACRDICNCSGANCMRIKRGWFPTNQLSHEARDQGFRSVAHYLVHTHVSALAAAAPIADNTALARPVVRQRPEAAAEDLPLGKRQRTLDFNQRQSREQQLQRASEARLQIELAAVMEELGGAVGPAGSALQQMMMSGAGGAAVGALAGAGGTIGGPFLGILDSDMQDDGDEEELPPSTAGTAGAGASGALPSLQPPALAFSGGAGSAWPPPGQHRSPAGAVHSGSSAGSFSHLLTASLTGAGMALDMLPPRRPAQRAPWQAGVPAVVAEAAQDQGDSSAATAAGSRGGAGVDEAGGQPDSELYRRLLPGDNDATAHYGLPDGGDAVPAERRLAAMRPPHPACPSIPGFPQNPAFQQRQRQHGVPHIADDSGRRRQPAAFRTQGAPGPEQPRASDLPHSSAPRMVANGAAQQFPGAGLDAEATEVEAEPQLAAAGQVDASELLEVAPSSPAGAANPTEEAVAESPVAAAADDGHGDEAWPGAAAELPGPAAAPGAAAAAASPGPTVDASSGATAALAASVALQEDERRWGRLCKRAGRAVRRVNDTYRHHPETGPQYEGQRAGEGADVAAYEHAHDSVVPELRGVLREAEAMLPNSAVVPLDGPAAGGDEGGSAGASGIYSHAGLRAAAKLLSYLALFLPAADVQWRVEKRLLNDEPFLDFGRSDVRARAILLGEKGLFELLAALQRRGLPTEATAAGVAGYLVCIAEEMTAALPLLDAIVAQKVLPDCNLQVGPWAFDSAARQKSSLQLFSELSALYTSLMQVLVVSLRRARLCAAGGGLGVGSSAFLSPALVAALLGRDRKLPREVKREALALLCAVLDASSPRRDAAVELDLSVNERSARAAARQRLCSLVQHSVVPQLEALVRQDYGMWGSAGVSGVGGSGQDSEESPSPSEHLGSEKVEALARCYAFLVECGGLGWPAVEATAALPYSFAHFWRQANAAHRHLAVFLLAHTLAHAPGALSAPACAASVVRVWLLALVDTGKRHCSWYLTRVLAATAATAGLFVGVTGQQLEIRADPSGEKRATLAAAVVHNAMMSGRWRPQLAALLAGLDEVLAARRREIEATTAFNPQAAALRWEAAGCKIVLAVLGAASPALAAATLGRPSAAAASPAALQLKQLLSRVAGWAVGSCAAVHAAFAVARNVTASSAAEPAEDDDDGAGLRSVADVRQSMRDTPFAALPTLWRILLGAGAPAALDADPSLLHPLWAVLSSCMELGSGEVEATPVDEVMMQMLGASLAPSPAPASTDPAQQEVEPTAAAATHSLCLYVLGTFVRRYLSRSSLKHASHERAAVNALRLAQEVLAQPSMRSVRAREAALGALLRPMLEVLSPSGGAAPSLAAKEMLYRLLTRLVTQQPGVLPPLVLSPDHPPHAAALHPFWLAVCRDALACVSGSLNAEARQHGVQLLAHRCAGRPHVLQPATPQTVAEASNALLGALGRPRQGCEAVERAYHGFVPAPIAGLFRPGDFQWELAKRGVELVNALVSLQPGDGAGTGSPQAGSAPSGGTGAALAVGPQWAMACFPALHYLIAGAGNASRPLHAAYHALRAGVEASLGAQALAGFAVRTVQPRQHVQPAAAFSAGGPAPQPQPQPQQFAGDQTLAALSSAPDGSLVSVTACLSACPQQRLLKGSPAATFSLKDLSAARASVVISQPASLVEQLLALERPNWRPLVVRFSQLRLPRRAQPSGQHPVVLASTALTALDLQPSGERAEALRAAFTTEGGQPAARAGGMPTHQPMQPRADRLESQATQEAVAVKAEPDAWPAAGLINVGGEGSPGHAQSCGADIDAARWQLLEMGYSREASNAALATAEQQQRHSSKLWSVEQVVQAAMQFLPS